MCVCVFQVVRLSGDALRLAAPGYDAEPATTLKGLVRRGFVGRKPNRVHCIHLHALPSQLRDLDEELPLKDRILGAIRLLVRPEDEVSQSASINSGQYTVKVHSCICKCVPRRPVGFVVHCSV